LGKVHSEIDAKLASFIARQRMFFVATAPSGTGGHVNLSPKGGDALHVLGPREVAYADLVGSGVETIAHLRQNGRIALLFCAFEGPPRLLRLHGRGRVIEPGEAEFERFRLLLPADLPVRALIAVALERVSDSCGYGVPLYEYRGERSQLREWAQRKGEAGVRRYQREQNRESIDGLPTLSWLAEDEL
jgi:hypothetical protein